MLLAYVKNVLKKPLTLTVNRAELNDRILYTIHNMIRNDYTYLKVCTVGSTPLSQDQELDAIKGTDSPKLDVMFGRQMQVQII